MRLITRFSIDRSLFTVCALLVSPALAGAQATWFVDDDAGGVGTGTAIDPFPAVQTAINAASSGDTVLVQAGTYSGFRFAGKDILVLGLDGPASTIVTGGVQTEGVLFDAAEGPTAVLEGFRIQNKSQGILCDGASPTIQGNEIIGNTSIVPGGGLSIINGAAPLVQFNLISGNMAIPGGGFGGGIYIDSSSPAIHGNVIRENSVFADFGDSQGAGIYMESSTVELIGNLIVQNSATDESSNVGAGLYALNSTLISIGNTFADNLALDGQILIGPPTPGEGGALYLMNTQASVKDTLFWNDNASLGAEIAVYGGALSISYSSLEGDLIAISGTGSVVPGIGVLATDPLFTTGYHIAMNSALIDVGDPDRENEGIDGDVEPRVLDGNIDGIPQVDIGWDEYDPTLFSVTGTPSLGSTIAFHTSAPAGWRYFLASSLGTADIPLRSFGNVLISPIGINLFASGNVPGTTNITIPVDPALIGVEVFLQALGAELGQPIGCFSRRISVVVE